MNEHTAGTNRRPRTDTRLLDDILFGLSGYWAVLVAHDLKLFPLLAANPCTLQEVCDRLQLARRPAEALLIVCVFAAHTSTRRPLRTHPTCGGLFA